MTTISEQDRQAVDDAFNKATPADFSYTATNPETNQTIQTFLLKSPAYYNLQNYIYTALKLDPTDAAFQSHYNVDALKDLSDLETNIYPKMMRTITDIFKHCHDFDGASMPKFMQLSAAIVNYCNDFARYVGGHGLLLDQMKILSDDASTPTQVTNAKTRAGYIANILSGRANDRVKDCQQLQGEITAFKDLTTVDKSRVDYLVHQFLRGGPYELASSDPLSFDIARTTDGLPVPRRDGSGNIMKPYSEILQKELQDLLNEASEDATAARKDMEEWKQDVVIATTAVSYMWLFPFGTIAGATVIGVYGDRAVKAKKRYTEEAAKAEWETLQANTLKSCVEIVNNLDCCFENLEDILTKALDALQRLEQHFLAQGNGFKALKDAIDTTDATNQDDDIIIRGMATDTLQPALENWVVIKTLAQDFIASTQVTYTSA